MKKLFQWLMCLTGSHNWTSAAQEGIKPTQAQLAAAQKELVRLRKDPDDALSEHPGCVYCMEAGTPVKDGEVCPKCGDRLPTRQERSLEKELAATLKVMEEAEREIEMLSAALRPFAAPPQINEHCGPAIDYDIARAALSGGKP